MTQRIFLAGAAGAIGRRLVPLLLERGHHVVGTTRSDEKANAIQRMGAEPVVVDVFDREGLSGAISAARPDVVIHQLTDLPPGLDPSRMGEAIRRNSRLRDEGTRNLVDAAIRAGVTRLVAQSIAWAYVSGGEPHREAHPLDTAAEGDRGISVRGVLALERMTLGSPPLIGTVLRYGRLYGPGTGRDRAPDAMPLHVDAAAFAAALAAEGGWSGAYNVAEPNGQVATGRIEAEAGWNSGFRLPPQSFERRA